MIGLAASSDEIADTTTVIGGDTLEIRGWRIRLHGIDTRESRQSWRLDGKPWQCGKDAANALTEKISRRPVACEEKDRNRYRRIVARCEAGGKDIGEEMVRLGFALAYRKYSRDYVDQEEAVKAAGRGIWASEFEAPWEWREKMRDAE